MGVVFTAFCKQYREDCNCQDDDIHKQHTPYQSSEDNFVHTNTQRTGDECHNRCESSRRAQLVLRFDEFRELAEDFLEGKSNFHGKTRDTLHQCWIEQYHLLPYGLVHYGGGGGEGVGKHQGSSVTESKL